MSTSKLCEETSRAAYFSQTQNPIVTKTTYIFLQNFYHQLFMIKCNETWITLNKCCIILKGHTAFHFLYFGYNNLK